MVLNPDIGLNKWPSWAVNLLMHYPACGFMLNRFSILAALPTSLPGATLSTHRESTVLSFGLCIALWGANNDAEQPGILQKAC